MRISSFFCPVCKAHLYTFDDRIYTCYGFNSKGDGTVHDTLRWTLAELMDAIVRAKLKTENEK